MDFQLSLSDLKTAINTIQRATNSNSTIPALEAIHFKIHDDVLILTCHNLEIGISASIPIIGASEIEDGFEFLINCKLLGEIVRKMLGENITFKITRSEDSKGTDKIEIEAEHSVFEISGVLNEGFTPLTRIEPEVSVTLAQNQLRELIRCTAFCAGTMDNKPVLTGCYLERVRNNEINEISMVALDGSRLAKRVISLETEDTELSVVIPSKSLNELTRIMGDTDDKVEIRISKSGAEFLFDNILFSSRVFNCPYVDYRRITSQCSFDHVFSVDTKKFLNAVERVSVLLSSETNKKPIILNIKDNKVEIFCNTSVGNSRDEIDVEAKSEIELQIAFNHKFLIDALRNVSSDKCIFRMGNNTSPILIEPPDGSDFVFVILPVRIR